MTGREPPFTRFTSLQTYKTLKPVPEAAQQTDRFTSLQTYKTLKLE